MKTIVLLVVCGLLGAGSARAVVPPRPGFDALIRQSGFIFEGRVTAIDTAAGSTGKPRTRVSIRIIEQYDGNRWAKESEFTFELPIGDLPDGRFVDIPEAPLFVPGETYLVFYTREPWRFTPVEGWGTGLLRLAPHPDGGFAWSGVDGRCSSGLGRFGIELGPYLGPSPAPPGWPERKPTGAPAPTRGLCLDADDLRDRLRRRLLELRVTDGGRVHSQPTGDDVEIPLAPAGEGD
ncbi:MAG: hypothetical protein H6705_17530 [Myxococcales bacterium]|nr:hypothetical protein [Myxococcales bacterium]